MASKVLTQTLLVVPANHSVQCPPLKKQLGFPLNSSCRFSLFNSRTNTICRASYSSNFGSIFTIPPRNSFVVRADAGSEDASTEANEDVPPETEVVVAEESPENSEAEASSEVESEARPPRQRRVKLGEIMGILNKRAVEAKNKRQPVPDIRTGDIVEIKWEVPENRRRMAIYKGIVMSKQNAGIHTTIRIRRFMSGVGVEIVFPLYSPRLKEIKVVEHRKVRKARLYYLRERLPAEYLFE